MSIRPVDFQLMINKTQDTHNTSNNAQRNQVSQQQFAEKFMKEVEHKDQHVMHSTKSENPNVDKDGKGNSSYNKRKKRGEQNAKKASQETEGDQSMFDVTV